jgi:hypothetical protein
MDDESTTAEAPVPHEARHIGQLLHTADSSAALLDQIRARDEMLAAARALIPEPLRHHCLQASCRNNCLVLCVDSPVWVQRLRAVTPRLLEMAAARGMPVSECKIRVLPQQQATPGATAVTGPPASPRAAAALRQASAALAGSPLGASLGRLANTLEGRRAQEPEEGP